MGLNILTHTTVFFSTEIFFFSFCCYLWVFLNATKIQNTLQTLFLLKYGTFDVKQTLNILSDA